MSHPARAPSALPPRAPATASIVELSAFRRRVRTSDRPRRATAELISLRRALGHEASVEIEGLESLSASHEAAAVAATGRRVRALLDREFGTLRVHRARRRFVVRHRSPEALMAGLLRVQFHARALRMPALDRRGERVESTPVAITWGVGRSLPEAELERLRRRRRHQQRRSDR